MHFSFLISLYRFASCVRDMLPVRRNNQVVGVEDEEPQGGRLEGQRDRRSCQLRGAVAKAAKKEAGAVRRPRRLRPVRHQGKVAEDRLRRYNVSVRNKNKTHTQKQTKTK